jgi:hypothetical protein
VAFNAIFETAQKQLRSIFGMEIVELRGKYTDSEKKGKGKQNEEAESDGEGGPRASGPKERELLVFSPARRLQLTF